MVGREGGTIDDDSPGTWVFEGGELGASGTAELLLSVGGASEVDSAGEAALDEEPGTSGTAVLVSYPGPSKALVLVSTAGILVAGAATLEDGPTMTIVLFR